MELPVAEENETVAAIHSFSLKRNLLRLGAFLVALIAFQAGSLLWVTNDVLHSSAHDSKNTSNKTSDETTPQSNSTNSSEPSPTKPTIIIRLDGELGNHLGRLAGGFAVKWHLRETYGVNFRIMTVHQNNPRWVRAPRDLAHCFPKFRHWNFSRGVHDWPEYKRRVHQQENWLSNDKNRGRLSTQIHSNRTLQFFLKKYHDPNKPYHPMSPNDKISLPFLIFKLFFPPWAKQEYISRVRDLFEFDMTGDCCGAVPEEDETVYHFRNFGTELGPVRTSTSKLVDFGPNQTAYVLMGHLKEGDKVALITRFNDQKTKKQVAALRSRGLQVRVIKGQTGVQDFCFMLKAKKELISNAFSTFALWGGDLGLARSVRRYQPVREPVDGVEYLTAHNLPPPVLSNESKTIQTFKVIVGD